MYNKVVLVGHLTRDVELRYSQVVQHLDWLELLQIGDGNLKWVI